MKAQRQSSSSNNNNNNNDKRIHPPPPQGLKRTRAKRSCDFCRKRKSRCDADTSIPCSNCRAWGYTCEFQTVRKKRGPPSVYVDNLEKRCKKMEQLLTKLTKASIKELERNNFEYPLPSTDPISDDDENNNDDNRSFIDDDEDEDDANSSISDGHSSSNDSILEEQLMRLGIKDNDGITYAGRSASIELLNEDLFRMHPYITWPGHEHVGLQLTSHNELMVVRESRFDIGVSMRIDLDPSGAPAKHSASFSSARLPPLSQQKIDTMIALYFSHLHAFFPIINKSRFQKAKKPPSILVHSILALTFRFVSQHFPQNQQQEADYAAHFFGKVMRRLRDSTHSRIPHVQAAILMTLYLDDDDGDDAMQWYTLGTAIRMAQDLGLHRSCSHWKMLPQSEINTRHRLFYACYILDRWLSARGGKPLTILDRDFDTPLPSPTNGDGEDDEAPYRGFIVMVKLAEILGRVLKALYAPKAKHLNSNASLDDPTLLEAFDRRLKACKLGILEEDIPLTQKVYLELYYNLVVLLLHRPFLSQNAMSHHACTAAASNIGNLARHKLPTVRREDPDSCFSLTLPTCLVYTLFQCSLVHLANAVRDPNTSEAFNRSMTLIQQFEHMVTARRAHQVLIMFRTIHFAWLLDPVSHHHQQQQHIVCSNGFISPQPHSTHPVTSTTETETTHLYNWPASASPSLLPSHQPPSQGTFLLPHQTHDLFAMTASHAPAHDALPTAAAASTAAAGTTKAPTPFIHHQHANSMSSTSSSSSFVSTPHPVLWSDWDVYDPHRAAAAAAACQPNHLSFDFNQPPPPSRQ